MALDRQSIEKRDFPVGSRGYDPDAVDAHLAALAVDVAEYKRSARRRADTLAAAASDQVRAIVQAAESSAAEIQRQAEAQALEIREEASSEAGTIRGQAREYVASVSDSANSMIARLDGIERELSVLVDSLRAGGGRFRDQLQVLEDDLQGLSSAVSPRPRFEPERDSGYAAAPSGLQAEPDAADAPLPEAAGLQGVVGDPEHAYDPDAAPGGGGESEHAYDPGASAGGGGESGYTYDPGAPAAGDEPEYTYDPDNPDPLPEEGEDAEGARLIALNMALNGTPRSETERYLTENFQLSNAGGLLDEVYASVEG